MKKRERNEKSYGVKAWQTKWRRQHGSGNISNGAEAAAMAA